MANLQNTHVVFNKETSTYEVIDLTTGQIASSTERGMDLTYLYNLPLAKHICQRIAEGETLKKICSEEGMPKATVIAYWRGRHPDFDEAIKLARKQRAEFLHDRILEEADLLAAGGVAKDDISAAKVAIDAYRWAAEKNDRETFGPGKVEQSASGPATIVINTGITRQPQEVQNEQSIRRGPSGRAEGRDIEVTSGREEED